MISPLPGLPSTSTRSHGTSTSSNTAMQSISSNRLDSGWSKRDRGSGDTVSRQMNLRPGVFVGMPNARAYASSPGGTPPNGMTATSSVIGAIVPSILAPRTTMPSAVSDTRPRWRNGSSCCADVFDRSICGIDQHVRQEQVLLAHVLVVARGVLAVAGARAREPIGPQVPARHELVHEVGRAAHEAEVVVRAQLEVLPLLDQLLARVRDEERRRDRLPARGRRIGHHVAIRRIELHVVLLGDRADGLLEDGLGGDVGDPPAVEVHDGRALPQRLDVLGSTASWHGGVLSCAASPRRRRFRATTRRAHGSIK